MYVELEVQLHGLNPGSVDDIRDRVQRALDAEFNPDTKSHLIVEIQAHTGGDCKFCVN
jgi:hypothetical protein